MRPLDSFIEQPIRSLQTMLRVISLDAGQKSALIPDGIYGPSTMYAVSAFQRKQELPVTGITDQATWDQIVVSYLEATTSAGNAQAIEVIIDPGKVYQYGDSSPYLYLLQGMLASLSDDHPAIPRPSLNGVMDAETTDSVRGFQLLSSLAQTGQVDKITWKNLALQFALNAHHKDQIADQLK